MHSVIQYADDGQVLSVSKLNNEEAVAGKLAAMARAGQKAVVLWYAEPSTDILLLVWDAEQGRLTRRAETLVELRAPLLQRLKLLHGSEAQADMPFWNGVVQSDVDVQGDGRAQSTVLTFALRIRAGEKNPHGGIWRLKDNSDVPFTDADVLALSDALQNRNADYQARAWQIADAIRAMTDPALLKAFDLGAAWISAGAAVQIGAA